MAKPDTFKIEVQVLHDVGSKITRIIFGGSPMKDLAKLLWRNEEGQDIAEYAVMLAVILVIVIGTVRLIGGNANNVFSSVASSISQ
jgi:Flp pilus assembly pilin Flp